MPIINLNFYDNEQLFQYKGIQFFEFPRKNVTLELFTRKFLA